MSNQLIAILENQLRERVGQLLDDAEAKLGEVPEDIVDVDTAALAGYFTELELRRRDLEGYVEIVKKETAKIGERLLEKMGEAGIDNLRANGLTVYKQTKKYCNKKGGITKAEMCDILVSEGWGHLVDDDYAPGSLKSQVLTAIADEEAEVPQRILDCLNISEAVALTTRK